MSSVPRNSKTESIQSHEKDSLGFTESEKVALKNCWRIVKVKKPIFTMQILYDFLMKNPKYFKVFMKRGRNEYNLPLLHSHPHEMFKIFDMLIEESLNPVVFLSTLKDFHTTHRFLECQAIQLMAVIINDHLKVLLKRYMSPTLDNALDKFCMALVYTC